MSDLRKQIRDHYGSKSLHREKVGAILAGAGSSGKVFDSPQKWMSFVALAASLVFAVGLAVWWARGPEPIPFALLAPRVVEFFSTPPELPKRSQQPEELRGWLIAQGAPADFQIPDRLRALESLGCQRVDVHGRPAWLACFWRDNKPDRSDSDLVHLWVVRKEDFKDTPPFGDPQFRELRGRSFASWSQGGVVYTLAAAVSLEKLRLFVLSRIQEQEQLVFYGVATPISS